MHVPRISGRRFAAIVLAGPVIGLLVYIGAIAVTELPKGDPDGILPVAGLILFLGWPVGAVPALLAALAWSVLPIPAGVWQRTGLAAGVGAVAGLAGVCGAVLLLGLQFPPGPVYPLIAVCGALALIVTAVPGHAQGSGRPV